MEVVDYIYINLILKQFVFSENAYEILKRIVNSGHLQEGLVNDINALWVERFFFDGIL